MAMPAGASAGSLPAVLHIHTWSGLTDFERQRANRTAQELGYIGFAISIYTATETTQAQTGSFYQKAAVAGSYSNNPERFVSRIAAAVDFIKMQTQTDVTKIGIVGYCFGGTGSLHFARTGEAATKGVAAVASFHGGLQGLASAYPQKYCPTRVSIFNGAGDPMISDADITTLSATLNRTQTQWELTNYSGAQHGFTHPSDGSAHFHYDARAEQRSWLSMANFLSTTFVGSAAVNASNCRPVLSSGQSGQQGNGGPTVASGANQKYFALTWIAMVFLRLQALAAI
jgi:dienelactone hydrolase